ncbi:hypothetical protein [Paractinoplanes atraurantiacus]|uniref:Lysyl-tRNA synthetase, class 2 n=1 Tax=Paractinoplanes atraurantiacus TaxID=1036182 RepID=A0A285JL49_9ACTN|nr:hypothetical protein [Actinoplanes atraurantiacus]SNY61042.1 lysyl-tRNA synthetase, class 2 [Actinoplanes atraurantiacus]
MSLTGRPLLALAATLTVVVGVATVVFWPRGGRLRPVTRTAGILLLEVLVVLTAGLEYNRREQFYPSWQALRGDTGTVAVTGEVRAGLLDGHALTGTLEWRPPGWGAWHLARAPRITVPADYANRPDVAFPVVLAFGGTPRRTTEAVTVTVEPTAATTATALLTLPAQLGRDLRVTAIDWDVRGSAPLAAAFVKAAPAGLAVLDQPDGALPPALKAPKTLKGLPT